MPVSLCRLNTNKLLDNSTTLHCSLKKTKIFYNMKPKIARVGVGGLIDHFIVFLLVRSPTRRWRSRLWDWGRDGTRGGQADGPERTEDLEELLQNDLGPRIFLTSGPEGAVDPRLELGRLLLLVLLLELLGSELLLLHLEVGVELAVVGVVAWNDRRVSLTEIFQRADAFTGAVIFLPNWMQSCTNSWKMLRWLFLNCSQTN